MKISKLTNSGLVECLSCSKIIRYAPLMPKNGCECGNLHLECRNDHILLEDIDGDHRYDIKTDAYLRRSKKTLFVDIDETLAENNWPFIGRPNTSIVKLLKKWQHCLDIRVHSCRLNQMTSGGPEEVEWHRNQIRIFLLQNGLEHIKISDEIKPYAGLVIDNNVISPAPIKYLNRILETLNGQSHT